MIFVFSGYIRSMSEQTAMPLGGQHKNIPTRSMSWYQEIPQSCLQVQAKYVSLLLYLFYLLPDRAQV
jgi:hypothetical protein